MSFDLWWAWRLHLEIMLEKQLKSWCVLEGLCVSDLPHDLEWFWSSSWEMASKSWSIFDGFRISKLLQDLGESKLSSLEMASKYWNILDEFRTSELLQKLRQNLVLHLWKWHPNLGISRTNFVHPNFYKDLGKIFFFIFGDHILLLEWPRMKWCLSLGGLDRFHTSKSSSDSLRFCLILETTSKSSYVLGDWSCSLVGVEWSLLTTLVYGACWPHLLFFFCLFSTFTFHWFS